MRYHRPEVMHRANRLHTYQQLTFWKGFGLVILAAIIFFVCLLSIGLIAYYSHKYDWK